MVLMLLCRLVAFIFLRQVTVFAKVVNVICSFRFFSFRDFKPGSSFIALLIILITIMIIIKINLKVFLIDEDLNHLLAETNLNESKQNTQSV